MIMKEKNLATKNIWIFRFNGAEKLYFANFFSGGFSQMNQLTHDMRNQILLKGTVQEIRKGVQAETDGDM